MENIKELQTRIALKYDSYSKWTSAPGKDLILLRGEIGICEIPSGNTSATTAPTVLFKVGDGVTPFSGLKWVSALAADVYDWAKAETVAIVPITTGDGDKAVTNYELQFKTGDTVKYRLQLDVFATDAEVEAVRSALASDISALKDRVDAIDGDTGAIATAIETANDYTDSQVAAVNEKIGGSYDKDNTVAAAIADAKKAGTDAATAVNTLATGQVATNTTAIDGINTEIGNLQEADRTLSERVDRLDLFFGSANADGVDNPDGDGKPNLYDALDTLQEIQDYILTDGAAAEQMLADISALKTAVGGTDESGNKSGLTALVDTAQGRADDAYTLADQAKQATDRLADILNGEGENAGLVDTVAGLVNQVNDSVTGLDAVKQIADTNKSAIETIQGDYLKAADMLVLWCGTSDSVVDQPSSLTGPSAAN